MSIFSLESTRKVSEKLIKGQDYIEVLDGNQVARNYVNLDNPKWCKQDGIMEFIPLKEAKGVNGHFKHENEKRFKTTLDKTTGLTWGIPKEIDPETKIWSHEMIIVKGNMVFDLSIKQQAMYAACIKNSCFCEGSPNLVGTPIYKVNDREVIADKKIKEITYRRKAEDIIFALNYDGIKELALNFGVNLAANTNPSMLTAELHRVMNKDPKAFVEMYNDPNRVYVSILNKAISLNVITVTAMQAYMYGGQTLGHSKETAIKYLMDNNNTSTTISMKCKEIEAQSLLSNKVVYEEPINRVESEKEFDPADYKAPFATEDAPKEDNNEMDVLRERARLAGVKGYQLPTMSYEKLLSKTEEAEKIK